MLDLLVDGFLVTFDTGWVAGKFDEWAFYKKHFSGICAGLKAIDVIAISPERVLYLIEFKDYRGRRRDKIESVEDEFIGKALFTLSALLPAKCNARDINEQAIASRALCAARIRLVLHIDQSQPGNKLFSTKLEAANITQKLRTKLKPIGPGLIVCNSQMMNGLPWTISQGA